MESTESCTRSNELSGGVYSTSSLRLSNNTINDGVAEELAETIPVMSNYRMMSSDSVPNSTNKKKLSRGVNISHMVNFQLERRTGTNSSTTTLNTMNRHLRTRGNSSRHRPAQCYLHTSSNHRFSVRQDGKEQLKNRVPKDHGFAVAQQQSPYLPSWEVIDAVTVLVDVRQQQHQQQRCAICLEDPYQVPRIFPCGHIFCFVCILQYTQHSLYNQNSMANPNTTSTATTVIPCPCCSKQVAVPQELRSVQFQSVSSPALGCSMAFRKICRYKANPEATTTTAIPLVAIQGQYYAENPNQTDPNSIYFRTVVQDTQLALQQLTWEAKTLQSMQQQPTATVSAESELQHYLEMAEHLIQLDIHKLLQQEQQSKHDGDNLPQYSLSSNADIIGQASCNSNNREANTQQSFYQAIDGQLCFLCGFTMRCLLHEYNSSHDALPNEIDGRILGIETIQLDATLRKRYSFLQQYPNSMEVQLVELQLSPGILSKSTKQHFSKEFMKRKTARQRQTDKQQKQQKVQQQQQQYISYGSFYNNPTSEFTSMSTSTVASPLSEDFGPSLVPSPVTTSDTNVASTNNLQLDPNGINSNRYTTFKAVLTTGGVWPELTTTATSTNTNTASSPTTMAAKLRNQLRVSSTLSTSDDAIQSSSVATPKDDTKDKSRKKKVVLFSTGGHRGFR
jgi:hypothetical protein